MSRPGKRHSSGELQDTKIHLSQEVIKAVFEYKCKIRKGSCPYHRT
jgi:hypothetical protein